MTARQQRGEGHPSTAGPLGQQVFEIRLDVNGWKAGPGLHTDMPSGPTRRFQATSLRQTGDRVKWGSVMKAVV